MNNELIDPKRGKIVSVNRRLINDEQRNARHPDERVKS